MHIETIGLQPNEKRPHILHVSPGDNLSWPLEDGNLTYTIPSGMYLYVFVEKEIQYLR